MPSTSVAEITQESLQQILLVVREEMKQMRADILDAHNPAPARPQSHWFGTASSFPSFDNQTHPLDSPWHQFQTMQQQQQAVQQLQLQLQHRIQQEMYTLQQVQLVTQQQTFSVASTCSDLAVAGTHSAGTQWQARRASACSNNHMGVRRYL